MTARLECFARLGVEEGVDERQVRRAYARELKLIDQERDLEGFQHLRTCYEVALEVARQAEPVDVGAAVAPPATDEAPDMIDARPHATARIPMLGAEDLALADDEARTWLATHDPRNAAAAVFADFRIRIAELAALPERHAHYESWRLLRWSSALREVLADQRLVHLEAPAIFEQHVADLLAAGWQPGHHLLFPAAVEVFGWDEEHDALERLGHTGRVLDAALAQRTFFQYQDILARTKQREVFLLLRQPRSPRRRKLGRYVSHLLTLVEHFPDLLYVLAPHAAVTAWRERFPAAMPAPLVLADDSPDKDAGSSGAYIPGLLVVLCFLIMYGQTFLFGGETSRQAPVEMAPVEAWETEMIRGVEASPPSDADAEPITFEEMGAIQSHMDYTPAKRELFDPQFVRYRVTLDADGNVVHIAQLETSTDPAFGIAAEHAIRAAAPFHRRKSKAFGVGVRVERKSSDASS